MPNYPPNYFFMNSCYILQAKRTPIGSYLGKLSTFSAPQLGVHALKGVLGEKTPDIDALYFGNVLSANVGQAPARQVCIGSGLSSSVPCTTINKVCASGLKAAMLGAQGIQLGFHDSVVVGGMESMSQVPYYLPKARVGYRYGHGELVDGLAYDGLHEVYNNFAMGHCAEHIAKAHNISREEQDAYAISSYKRAHEATESGFFQKELVSMTIPIKRGVEERMEEDEEFRRVNYEKIPSLRPVFDSKGSVTAANASTMNDGAAALLLGSKEYASAHGYEILARIVGYTDAAQDPLHFTTTPALALQRLFSQTNTRAEEIDFFEINEAFSVVALINQRLLSLSSERLNVWGGAVSLGHPLGCSGARILVTLCHILAHYKAKKGVVAICNGGGGASAMLIERIGA